MIMVSLSLSEDTKNMNSARTLGAISQEKAKKTRKQGGVLERGNFPIGKE